MYVIVSSHSWTKNTNYSSARDFEWCSEVTKYGGWGAVPGLGKANLGVTGDYPSTLSLIYFDVFCV